MELSERMYYDMARDVAKRYGLFVVIKGDYLLFRSAEGRNMFIGKRKKAKALYSFVKQVTGHK